MDREQSRSRMVSIRMLPQEEELVRAAAGSRGKSISAFIRDAAKKALTPPRTESVFYLSRLKSVIEHGPLDAPHYRAACSHEHPTPHEAAVCSATAYVEEQVQLWEEAKARASA